MASGPPDVIAKAYESLSRQDLDAWLEVTTSDVEVHEVAEMPGGGVYRGQHQARAWAEETLQLVDEWQWTPGEVLLDAGDIVVVRVSVTGCSKAGVPIDLTVFHVIRFEGGRLASFQGFFDRARALEAAGLRE